MLLIAHCSGVCGDLALLTLALAVTGDPTVRNLRRRLKAVHLLQPASEVCAGLQQPLFADPAGCSNPAVLVSTLCSGLAPVLNDCEKRATEAQNTFRKHTTRSVKPDSSDD